MVGPAAKALVVGQPTVGNSARQYRTVRVNSTRQVSAVTVLPSLKGLVPKPNKRLRQAARGVACFRCKDVTSAHHPNRANSDFLL